jgi:hypothetical protein
MMSLPLLCQEVLGVSLTERDRLRQEQNRRAAGIPPRGAQEALDEATGYRDEFGRLTDPG